MRSSAPKIIFIIVIILLIGIYYAVPFLAPLGAVRGWSRHKPDVPEFKWAMNFPANFDLPPDALFYAFNVIGPYFPDNFSIAADPDGNLIIGTDKLSKHSHDGDLIWELNPDNTLLNGIIIGFSSIAVDETGQCYAAGYKESASGKLMTFGYPAKDTNYDAFIIIADPEGEIIKTITWDQTPESQSWPCAIVLDKEKNIYLCGNFMGSIDFDPGIGEVIAETKREQTDYRQGEWEINSFIVKLNSDGEVIKTFSWDGYTSDLIIDDTENLFACGNFYDIPISTLQVERISLGALLKLNKNLECQSLSKINERFYSPLIVSRMDFNGQGNIFCVGALDIDYSLGFGPLGLFGHADCATRNFASAELDKKGNVLKRNYFEKRNPRSFGTDIAYDGDKNIYFTGSFVGSPPTDFDPGRSVDKHIGQGMDAFLTCYDSEGNYKWTGSFGGDSDDMATDVVATNDGRIYVMGYFSGTVDFDPGQDVFELTSSDPADIFLVAYEIP